MTDIMVVDDQILIRAGLVAMIKAMPGLTVVGEAATGEEAVSVAASAQPEVILMDIRMPGLSGIGATERILADGGAAPPKVLILTTFDLDEYVYAALRAGASGFLLKDTSPERLFAAITAIAGGDMLFAPTVVRRLIEANAPAERPLKPAPALDVLTGREREVLLLVARGLSNAEIALELFLSEATVKTHLNRLMSKLALSSRAQAVVVAYETGLVTPGNAQS
ncbi:DNA-binding NarL/FixJ family response regulator [Allocatelliglobosispora scoriae]|uniref:DNA-binding NarL/FixJ family response regulator n=1 Tax=Allocatelliglobosispora scoriae TaxID=643052 RepID=A0A841BUC2_9ACTN|nr:response regulator transcription factor [Allocatelliglobosispora scoriae]MBB5872707.1 DNA-binding NarL/FixJ family response regulator [Allocatelliglobosispora scoriae]